MIPYIHVGGRRENKEEIVSEYQRYEWQTVDRLLPGVEMLARLASKAV